MLYYISKNISLISMSRTPVLNPYSTAQCIQSCNNQKGQCLNNNISDPSDTAAFQRQQCISNGNKCVTSCTTNNIRSGSRR